MKKPTIANILTILTSQYGARVCHPSGEPMNVLVETILSQNTSDTNSGRAFKSLRAAFPTWEAVAEAPAAEIASAIRVGGLDKIKAARIKNVLAEIKAKRGNLDLAFLNDLPVNEARGWLRQLPGVGAKTANCVLLFAFCKPALPVDTHIHRVSKRLGLIDAKASAEKAHDLLEEKVSAEQVYPFHVLLIEHGRSVCKAQRPRCGECGLGGICPSCEMPQ